jgi:hypothetical protein
MEGYACDRRLQPSGRALRVFDDSETIGVGEVKNQYDIQIERDNKAQDDRLALEIFKHAKIASRLLRANRRISRLTSVLESIGGLDCPVSPACGQCVTCLARSALKDRICKF